MLVFSVCILIMILFILAIPFYKNVGNIIEKIKNRIKKEINNNDK